MKASELMIGDWVRNALLNEVFKMNTTSMRNMCWDEDHGMARYTIEPIHLTEDILKANGFEYDDLCYEWHHDKFPTLYEGENDFYNYYDGHEIHYKFVHQLQHALRLCGLNYMADNFKVK